MKRAFPVLIKKNDDAFPVFVPDLEICTEGKDMADAIAMARDAIGARGVTMEDMGQEIPEASTVEEAVSRAKKDADEIFDYSDGIITFVDVDLAAYRSRL
jgi:predicted RNase H-like HicB family nuclease